MSAFFHKPMKARLWAALVVIFVAAMVPVTVFVAQQSQINTSHAQSRSAGPLYPWASANDDVTYRRVDDPSGAICFYPNAVNPPQQPTPTPISYCGHVLGQHCVAIWSDRTVYSQRDREHICYSVAAPGTITLSRTNPDGSNIILYNGLDDGTGYCADFTYTNQLGVYHLYITTAQGSASTSYTIVP